MAGRKKVLAGFPVPFFFYLDQSSKIFRLLDKYMVVILNLKYAHNIAQWDQGIHDNFYIFAIS